MPILISTLQSGIEIRAVQVLQLETFEGGLAIGVHNEDRVSRHIEIFTSMFKPLIPTCPIIALLPHDLASRRRWCLPFYTSILWFTSDFVHDPQRMGTHLAVIYFQDQSHPYLSEENEQLLAAIDRQALATDFDY